MTRPTARVLAMLELLQAGGTRSVGALAALLEVDERTVRRYAEHLLDLGVPIERLRGRYGGYRIGAGSRLPPLMLTDDEAVAAVLGLADVARTGPSPLRPAAETAAAKLRRVLPDRLVDRVPGLAAVRRTAPAPAASATSTEAILVAGTAVREHRPIRIRYRGRDGVVTERTVLPWGVVEHEGRWYVAGHDSRSDAVRTFRLDRMAAIGIGEGRFVPPDGVDPARVVLESLASAPREHTVRVLVRASEERIRRHLPAATAVLQPVPAAEAGEDGWVRVALEAQHLDWVAGVLALVDAPFVVEEPARLRDAVLALAARLTERAAR